MTSAGKTLRLPLQYSCKVRHKRHVLNTHRSKVIEEGDKTKKFGMVQGQKSNRYQSENKNKVKSFRLCRTIQCIFSDHPSWRHARKHVLVSPSTRVELCHLRELGVGPGRFWWSGGELRARLVVQSAGPRKGLGYLHSTSRQRTPGASGLAIGDCQGNYGNNGGAGADSNASLCANRKATVRW